MLSPSWGTKSRLSCSPRGRRLSRSAFSSCLRSNAAILARFRGTCQILGGIEALLASSPSKLLPTALAQNIFKVGVVLGFFSNLLLLSVLFLVLNLVFTLVTSRSRSLGSRSKHRFCKSFLRGFARSRDRNSQSRDNWQALVIVLKMRVAL